MKFKIDENIPPTASEILKESGYDAHSVHSEKINGCNDDYLLGICKKEGRALITIDLDFSDIRRYNPVDYNGIIIIRSYKQSRDHILAIIRRIVPLFKTEDVSGRLLIVEDDRVRIR